LINHWLALFIAPVSVRFFRTKVNGTKISARRNASVPFHCFLRIHGGAVESA
jgi:hypothetical protein